MTGPRRVATALHRYVGLGLALFLTLVGLTGALIAWNSELERVFAPSMFVLPAESAGRPLIDIFALRDMAARQVPGFAVNGLDFHKRTPAPVIFQVDALPGGLPPPNDQIALDPTSGAVLGARRYGDIGQGAINIMPFVYELHDSLLLGDAGVLILGMVALLWTIDCFIGAWLTLPAVAGPGATWWRRWRQSWTVRRPRAPFKLVFDLHRAGGLWLWGMLFVLAWSSVSFNLSSVYEPVMATLFGGAPAAPPAPVRSSAVAPRLDWRQAHAAGQSAMAALARSEGFVIRSERLMFYDPATHRYFYRVTSDRDPGPVGNTQATLDGDSGRVVDVRIPTGSTVGTTITTWLGALHTASAFAGSPGRAWQVLISAIGLGIAGLSVTGVLIWWRKHRARRHHRSRGLRLS